MTLIKKGLGKIVYGIGRLIYIILDSIIGLLETLVLFVKGISKALFLLLSMGGCLFIILFATWGFRLLMDPTGLTIILFLIGFPILATRFVTYLRYIKYIFTEYLFNLSNYLIDSKGYSYKSLKDFKLAYRRAQEERRREQERRFYEQQRQWQEQFFKQQWQQQGFYGGQGSYGGYQGSFGGNLSSDFKKQYEVSCDILDVPYSADKNQIKAAYRKKAKEHHPDLNKDDPNATQMFQQITNAYEFLSDENILRYKNIK